ncbi:MAG: PhoH family protein [Campylobacterota bacterium]|nr:PhoH family protein [Campylobacterota bacterium]
MQVYTKYFVIDTNIILQDASNIFKLSDDCSNLVIIPETVLDEIDSKKSGFEEINFQAREFARILEGCSTKSTIKEDDHTIINIEVDGDKKAHIQVISKDDYKANSKNTQLNIYNDRKILEIASFAQVYHEKVIIFLSLDIMARTRAISLGLVADFLKGDNDEFDFQYEKTIEIEFDDQEFLPNGDILDFDKEHKPYNYSYNFKVKNSDQVILANIINGKIDILDEHEVRDQITTPLNKEQLFFSNALNSSFYDVIIVDAKAGSGKTLLALSGAIKKVRRKQYQKIIYIRNSIESLDKGEDIGYLPGYEEKFAIYNHPLMDSLNYMVRSETKKRRAAKNKIDEELDEAEVIQRVENMVVNYGIQTMWVGEMRGRTLSNSFIIIDEAQNMSNKTMQMVLSRIDNTCKVVILGSNKQIDNFYVNRYTNALTTLLKSTQDKTSLVNIFAIKLQKVLRGPITQWAEDIFSKE